MDYTQGTLATVQTQWLRYIPNTYKLCLRDRCVVTLTILNDKSHCSITQIPGVYVSYLALIAKNKEETLSLQSCSPN